MKEYIETIKFSKARCGLDFMIDTADNTEKRAWFDQEKRYSYSIIVSDYVNHQILNDIVDIDGLRIIPPECYTETTIFPICPRCSGSRWASAICSRVNLRAIIG